MRKEPPVDGIIELIEDGDMTVARSYRGGPYYQAGDYIAKVFRNSADELEDSILYRATCATAFEVSVASALELIDAPPLEDSASDTTYILSVGDGTSISDEVSSYLESLSVVYDGTSHPELAVKKETMWGGTVASYSGKVPANIAYFSCRTRALEAANRFWKSSSIVCKDYPRKTLQKLSSLKKSESLINALLLGNARMHITQRRGKVKDGTQNLLSRIDYLSDDLPEEVGESLRALRMFEDVASLWQRALRDADIAVALNPQDLDDAGELAHRMEALARFTLMEDYMETYLAGVPAEDILA